ncbi:MAG: monovalent cation/H+ antiporter complex subunit F, partial [Candidatus Binatia bacterium]
SLYFESVLVLALLAFVGTTAIAKALMRGRIIE